MNNKWHVWYLYYVKKIQIVSRSYDIALRLCGETGVYMTEFLHSYLPAFVITAPIAVAMDHYLAVILTPQPLQCTSMFLIFWLRFLMNEYVYVICNDIGLYIKEGLFLYCWLLCFCALGADCQFVVQCSNLVIICCS